MHSPTLRAGLLVPLFAGLMACNGTIGDAGDDLPLTPFECRGGGVPPCVVDPENLPEFVPAAVGMSRLRGEQYQRILTDAFGELDFDVALEEDETTAEFSTHGAAQVTTSSRGVEQYREAAMSLAEQILENRERFPVLEGCVPAQLDDACITDVAREFGARLFRRELTEEEVTRYTAIVGAAGADADLLPTGLRYMIAGLLQSPHFLYVPAFTETDTDRGMERYTSDAMASRLALLFWGRAPDEALRQAAAEGRLSTTDGLETETRRLLAHENAQDFAGRFFMESWHVSDLEDTDKVLERFPEWSADRLEDFQEEMRLVLRDLTWQRDGDLLDVFDGRQTFTNGALAEFYGLAGGDDSFEPTGLDVTRFGLLTSGAVIAANSATDRSTPTERGVFVLERLLCRDLAAPPVDALAEAGEELSMIEPGDERGFIMERLENPSCGGCHSAIDPLGMVFDDYNAIGRYREGEDQVGALGNEPYASIGDLAAELRQDPAAASCIASRLYNFASAHPATENEARPIHTATEVFTGSENSFQELMVAIVTSDGFRFAANPEAE